jgi:hypothetical protein
MSLISPLSQNSSLQEISTLELAQALAERLAIAPNDWHKLKNNRQAQALQQASAGLVFLLKNEKTEAIAHLSQSVGWLDRSVAPLPCPTHGHSS